MIGGMTEHDGHPDLANHVASRSKNETVSFRTHGLSARTIAGAIAELRLMGHGCSTSKPLVHAWASPSVTYSEADWDNHRAAFEEEFGLQGFPCLEVFHLKLSKGGRTARHAHRVYLRVGIDGKAVRTSHSAVRQEKVSRIAEFMAGERLTSGCFNEAVIERLRRAGRNEIADAMVHAGLRATNATSAPTSAERAEAERRRDLAPDEVWRRTSAAWRRSDDGPSFIAALADLGLRIAQGEKCPVVVAPAGAVHPLLRAINKGGERQDGRSIRKTSLEARLRGIALPAVREIGPVRGFDAGPFAVTNLDRVPVPATSVASVNAVPTDVAPLPPIARPELTLEQEAALLEFEDALHSTAADRANATRKAIESEILDDIVRRKASSVDRRISEEKRAWDLPSIGLVGWRDAYRAELAGLPKKYGLHLRWVDRLDAERSRSVLRSGAIVTLAPTEARTTRATGDSVAIMIGHALEQGWPEVTIEGGTQDWRLEMARAGALAGLAISNPELRAVALITEWWSLRRTLANTPMDQRATLKGAVLSILGQLANAPDVVSRVTDVAQRRELIADLAMYRHYRSGEQPTTGPPPTRPR